MSADCLFCKIVKKEIPSQLVFEDERTIAFHDLNPQAPTHILIVPKKHIEKHSDLSVQDKGDLSHLHSAVKEITQKEKISDYRLVINNGASAGQSVWHLHMHLLSGRPFHWPPG